MNNIMRKVAAVIVDRRVIILIAFLVAGVYCGLSIDRVKVNSDITAFLPAETDTDRKSVV